MKFALLAFVSLLCFGCVYLDTSMLDTAEPLRPGKPEFQYYWANGLDLDTAVFIPNIDYNPDTQPQPDSKAGTGTLHGIKVALGIGYDSEVAIKFWAGEGEGVKGSIKKRIFKQDDLSVAINPGYTYLRNNDNDLREVTGVELPLICTFRPTQGVALTVQGHYNLDMYSRDVVYNNSNETTTKGPYNITHYGVIGGVNLRYKIFNLYWELGLERVNAMNGPVSNVRTGALGLGIEM